MSSPLADMCNARVGRLLKGKWRLERVLGIGGMAAVYEGVHHIGRKDAIKILHPEVARQPDLKRRFEVEASATNRFRHKGAVEIRDFDTSEDGCPFLVMEMLDGESMGERVRRTGEIAEADLLRYVDQLLDVLVAAHREGIVHRDIKLDNIFITRDDEVKVLDFGVARILSGPVMTMAGTRLGTPAYMPPEQLRGLDVDGRADVFAVGATMFRLLTKRRIHEAPTEGQLILKMSTEPAPKTRSVEPSVSEHTALVVDRALAFLASARYQNALTMQEDVREVIAGNAPPWASARARADAAGEPAPGPSADRPTIAETLTSSSAFATDPTGATVHHRAAPTSPGAATAVTAFASSPTSATVGGQPVPVPAANVGRAAIASTVAANPAPFSFDDRYTGAALGPSDPTVGRRAIAATAPMPPSTPTPMPSSATSAVSSGSIASGAVAAASTPAWQPRASGEQPRGGSAAAPARKRDGGALAPILVVGGLTLVVGIVGVALFLHASAEESAASSSSAARTEPGVASGSSAVASESSVVVAESAAAEQPSASPSSDAATTALPVPIPSGIILRPASKPGSGGPGEKGPGEKGKGPDRKHKPK